MAKKHRKNGDYYYEPPKISASVQRKKSTVNKILVFFLLLLAIGVVSCLYFLLLHLDETVWMLNLPLFQIMAITAGLLISAMFILSLVKTSKYEKIDENGELLPISEAEEEKYLKLKKYIRILAFAFITALAPITMDIIITFFIK